MHTPARTTTRADRGTSSVTSAPLRVRHAGLAAFLLLALTTAPVAEAQDTGRLTASLQAITTAEGSDGRREAIVSALKALGVTPELRAFGAGAGAGTNIVVTLPGRDPRGIVVGAHYDSVPAGRGAVDNGAACAALIELIASLRASPPSRLAVTVVFFDREEAGLLGSRAFFADARPAYAVNIDIFAYGDTLFTTSSSPAGVLDRALRASAAPSALPVRDLSPSRYPGSDHESMMAAGVETIGLALVDAADADAISAVGAQGLAPGKGPRIISIIHTPRDSVSEVRIPDMVRAFPVLEQMIRMVDLSD